MINMWRKFAAGLDARAAAIVMRTVRNTVDTGRTVVCTIHQPSIDIFEVRRCAYQRRIEIAKCATGTLLLWCRHKQHATAHPQCKSHMLSELRTGHRCPWPCPC